MKRMVLVLFLSILVVHIAASEWTDFRVTGTNHYNEWLWQGVDSATNASDTGRYMILGGTVQRWASVSAYALWHRWSLRAYAERNLGYRDGQRSTFWTTTWAYMPPYSTATLHVKGRWKRSDYTANYRNSGGTIVLTGSGTGRKPISVLKRLTIYS